jgi:hypothetical protein
MNEDEQRKSAVASRGGKRAERETPLGPAGPVAEKRRADDEGGGEDADESEAPSPGRQPGGGRPSESEKPDSRQSRWGGGR